jgi:hypothetical protein
MSVHHYPLQSLLADYWRAGIGLIVGIGSWLLAPEAPHVVVICGGLTVLFLLFTMRTIVRQYTRIEMTDDGIVRSELRQTALRWSDLDRVKLRYYSTRRNRSRGWMTLKLGTGWTAISVDSTIDGFDAIAGRAARAITDNVIDVDEVTLANLAALGLTADAGEVRTGSVELSR